MTTVNSIPHSLIKDDYDLLNQLVKDSNGVPEIYRPGPYWRNKTKIAVKEIHKYGLADFRGFGNTIGVSYADKTIVDVRKQYNYGLKSWLSFCTTKIFLLSKIFNSQVFLTKNILNNAIEFKNQLANNSVVVKELLRKFKIPEDTIRGECIDYSVIGGKKISNHYLSLLKTHNALSESIDFTTARSLFEIGGGFGVNLHLLIENYKNLRKFVYLDIPPNLYVGTQYLKSFFEGNVKSYADTKNLKNIEFKFDDELEIFCIAPHQIENLNVKIDIFQNSHSFVEMPKNVVANYVKHIERLTDIKQSSIGLVSYDGFDLKTTYHPDELPKFFNRKFLKYEDSPLWHPQRKNYHYISTPACNTSSLIGMSSQSIKE